MAANGGSIIGIWFNVFPPRFMTGGDSEKAEGGMWFVSSFVMVSTPDNAGESDYARG